MLGEAHLDDDIEAFAHACLDEVEGIGLLVVGYNLNVEHNHVLVLLFEAVDDQLVLAVGYAVQLLDELLEALHKVNDQLIELDVVLVVPEALED